jgi:hypothetical protein
LDAAVKGDSIANVVKGQAKMHPISGGASSGDASTSSSSVEGYVNPVPGATTGRIDQGVDYTLGSQGFLAPAPSVILQADQTNSGWRGGGYIAAKITSGPLAGLVYYVAEGIAPLVQKGQQVAAGTRLGLGVSNPYNMIVGNIEAGWANPSNPGQPLAQTLSGYSGDQSTQALTAGYSFAKFIEGLGGVAGKFEGIGQALATAVEHEFPGGGQHPASVPYG